uniref:L-serine-phosphatidylethanolamine phosphatidyltransferase n=1 Tax=Syphacia muris TaxID=451379 RepID=A0A0N5AW90_9BILA
MVSSFALLVGNIRKTFIPASIRYIKPGHVELPIMAVFRLTIFLDVFLFWTSFMWVYCLQWHLCCRLGLCKFWLWTLTLVLIGTFVMVLPMSEIQKELDPSWCHFKPNSSFAAYQPRW